MTKYNQNPNEVKPDNKGYSTDIGMREDAGIFRDDFVKPSRAEYNTAHGRIATAPLSAADGGDAHDRSPRGRAPGSPSAKSVQPID
jgi:hypothetical protein